jgi:hypothetical protein
LRKINAGGRAALKDAAANTRNAVMPPESIVVVLFVIAIFVAFAVALAWGSMQTRQ